MERIDFDEAYHLCQDVKADLLEMLRAIKDRSFYDIGFDIGQMAQGGTVYESVLPEFDVLIGRLREQDMHALANAEWSICDLVNHYDSLYEHYRARSGHYKADTDLIAKLQKWKGNASKLAQLVCSIDE